MFEAEAHREHSARDEHAWVDYSSFLTRNGNSGRTKDLQSAKSTMETQRRRHNIPFERSFNILAALNRPANRTKVWKNVCRMHKRLGTEITRDVGRVLHESGKIGDDCLETHKLPFCRKSLPTACEGSKLGLPEAIEHGAGNLAAHLH